MMDNNVRKYLKEINLIIPLNSKEKKEFILMLENRIKETHLFTYEEIVNELGKPNEVASSFIDDMDTEILIQKLRKKKYVQWIVAIIIICIISVSLFKIWRLNQLYEEVREQQPVQIETTIE